MKSYPQITALIFDWDGTLLDSAHLGLVAFEKTFAELGVPFAHDIYEAKYSPNWYSTYEALGLPKEQWQIADDVWIRHYGEQSPELIEGAGATLLSLQRRGYQLGVVSSGNRSRVCREIEHSVLTRSFGVIVCHEDVVDKKPHPEGLELAMQILNVNSFQSAYVGDAPEDIEMGRRGNVVTIGVRSTYPSSGRVLNAKPDIYIERVGELLEHF